MSPSATQAIPRVVYAAASVLQRHLAWRTRLLSADDRPERSNATGGVQIRPQSKYPRSNGPHSDVDRAGTRQGADHTL